MSNAGRMVAGFVKGASQGALDYDREAKIDVREERKRNALFKQQNALAKYRQEGAEKLQAASIESSEGMEKSRIEAQKIKDLGTATRDENRIIAIEKANQDAKNRTPSGWLDENMIPVTEGQLKTASPEDKKNWYSPKDMAERNKIAKSAERRLDHHEKILLKKIERGAKTVASPKDVQTAQKNLNEMMFFEGDETPENMLSKTKEYMRSIGWTGSLVEEDIAPAPEKPGLSLIDSIDASMKKKLGESTEATAPIAPIQELPKADVPLSDIKAGISKKYGFDSSGRPKSPKPSQSLTLDEIRSGMPKGLGALDFK